MRRPLTMLIMMGVLAGCATPAPLMAPVANGLPAAQAAQKQAATVTPAKTVTTAPTAPKAPAAASKPATSTATPASAAEAEAVPTTLEKFDPLKAMIALPSSAPSAPDDPNDDADIEGDDGFATKGWLWGWGGSYGLTRGLKTFTKEEGRTVEWLPKDGGWTVLKADLTPAEEPGALAIAVGPNYNRVATLYRYLPDILQRHSLRHLKFFRKQDVVSLRSVNLAFYAVQRRGTTMVAGYIARAEKGNDRYVAYYDSTGRFLWACGTHTPMALPSPDPTPTPDPSTEPTSSPTAEPSTEPTPEPSAEPSADPSADPSPEPSADSSADS